MTERPPRIDVPPEVLEELQQELEAMSAAAANLPLDDEPQDDDGLDHVRPVAIPGWAVSTAASRIFGSRIPDGHPLEYDWRLVRFWWLRREAGLLRDDEQG